MNTLVAIRYTAPPHKQCDFQRHVKAMSGPLTSEGPWEAEVRSRGSTGFRMGNCLVGGQGPIDGRDRILRSAAVRCARLLAGDGNPVSLPKPEAGFAVQVDGHLAAVYRTLVLLKPCFRVVCSIVRGRQLPPHRC